MKIGQPEFESGTSCPPDTHANQLRYCPKSTAIISNPKLIGNLRRKTVLVYFPDNFCADDFFQFNTYDVIRIYGFPVVFKYWIASVGFT